LSDVIYDFIKKAAELERKSDEEFLVDLLIKSRVPRVDKLLIELSDLHLRRGELEERKGNLIDAGENYWLSLSYVLKLVAMNEDLEIEDYPSYYGFVEYLSYKLNDSSLIVDFVNAEKLHGEYHPRPQGEGFNIRRDHAIALITKIKSKLGLEHRPETPSSSVNG